MLRRRLNSVILLAALLTCPAALSAMNSANTFGQQPGPGAGAPPKRPITKTGLVNALKLGGLTTAELADQIKRRGVDFRLTSETEVELRVVGADSQIIDAVRASYRAVPERGQPPLVDDDPQKKKNLDKDGGYVVTGFPRAPSPLLTNPSSLRQFPTLEQVRASTKGTDEVDSHARFMAALWRINSIIIDDLVTAPNGGRFDIPPDADRVHTRYSNEITRLSIDQIPTAARDPRYRRLEDKYEKDPAFLDALLTEFFTPEFRIAYYAWVRKPVPQSSTHAASSPGKVEMSPPPAVTQCPKVKVTSPSEVDADMPITFTAAVTGGDREVTPTFNWTVSAGTISSGQGTSTIVVDTTGAEGQSSTATVSLGGYDRKCQTTQSSTTGVKLKAQPPRKIDEFGTLSLNQRNARLDNYAIELQNDPTAVAYVIAYGGRKSVPGAATSLGNRSKKYLVDTRFIEETRIVTVDGGYREAPTTELWIVPRGSTPPEAEPTVDPSEIKPSIKKKTVPKRTQPI